MPLSDYEIRKLGITPKSLESEVEFARQLSVALCASSEEGRKHDIITHSPWNRRLCAEVLSYPENNQF